MITVVLTIHSLIVLALIGVVLLQRSEGGALGMGGGGGGFMTGRGAATALTRTTSVLAALFFTTSIALAIFADRGESEDTLIEELTRANSAPAGETGAPGETSTDDLLRTLGAEGAQSPAASDMLESLGGQSETPAEEDAAPADEPASETPPAGTEDAPAQNEPQPEPQN